MKGALVFCYIYNDVFFGGEGISAHPRRWEKFKNYCFRPAAPVSNWYIYHTPIQLFLSLAPPPVIYLYIFCLSHLSVKRNGNLPTQNEGWVRP